MKNCPGSFNKCPTPNICTYECDFQSGGLYTKEGGKQVDSGLPVMMFDHPSHWFYDLVLTVTWWCGTLALIALVFFALGMATGLYRYF